MNPRILQSLRLDWLVLEILPNLKHRSLNLGRTGVQNKGPDNPLIETSIGLSLIRNIHNDYMVWGIQAQDSPYP